MITVWGLPEVFPLTGINLETNLRRVDSTGNIYFPYVGLVNAKGLTQNELRGNLTERLSEFFTDPQLDVGIGRFNSQKVYILGEITKPSKINLTDIPFSLSDALGEVNGLTQIHLTDHKFSLSGIILEITFLKFLLQTCPLLPIS